MRDASNSAGVFYQVSKIPELSQNLLAGGDGSYMFMRFLSWASRKSGEYAFRTADAMRKKDWKSLSEVSLQLAGEAMYAGKVTNMLDRYVDG